jgi:hypothetical protein
MGMRARQLDFRCASANVDTEWFEDAEPVSVTITMEADCLCRLLRQHSLYIEDFSCADEASQSRVRRMLLKLLIQKNRDCLGY